MAPPEKALVPAIPPKDEPAPPAGADESGPVVKAAERSYVVLRDFRARVRGQLLRFAHGATLDEHVGKPLHETGAPVRPVDPEPDEPEK
jgi:hypothetical protein